MSGCPQFVQTIAHFNADVIESQPVTLRRRGRVAHLYQQDFVVRPARGESHCLGAPCANFTKT